MTILFADKYFESLGAILTFYDERNGSTRYSKKLNRLFTQSIMRLAKFPQLGRLSDQGDVRLLFVKDFTIEYAIEERDVIILDIYSCMTVVKRK